MLIACSMPVRLGFGGIAHVQYECDWDYVDHKQARAKRIHRHCIKQIQHGHYTTCHYRSRIGREFECSNPGVITDNW
jgi:hypothetical protein